MIAREHWGRFIKQENLEDTKGTLLCKRALYFLCAWKLLQLQISATGLLQTQYLIICLSSSTKYCSIHFPFTTDSLSQALQMSDACCYFGTAGQMLKGSVPALTIMVHGQRKYLGPKCPCHAYLHKSPEIKSLWCTKSLFLLSGQLLQFSPLIEDPKRDALGYLPFAHIIHLTISWRNTGDLGSWNRSFTNYQQKWERKQKLMLPDSLELEFAGGIASSEVCPAVGLWQHSINSYSHIGHIIKSLMKNLIRILKLMAGNSQVWEDQDKVICYLHFLLLIESLCCLELVQQCNI